MSRENQIYGPSKLRDGKFQSAPGSMSRENGEGPRTGPPRLAVSIRSRLDEPGELLEREPDRPAEGVSIRSRLDEPGEPLFRAFCGGRGAVSIRSRLDEPGERHAPRTADPVELFQSAPGSMSRENSPSCSGRCSTAPFQSAPGSMSRENVNGIMSAPQCSMFQSAPGSMSRENPEVNRATAISRGFNPLPAR